MVKNLPASAEDIRDVDFIPKLGRFPEEANGNPLQYSCLENPTDRGTWWAIVHGVAKSWTRLKQLSTLIIIKWWKQLSINRMTNGQKKCSVSIQLNSNQPQNAMKI